MTLTLSVLRCPDAVPPEMREVRGGEFSIGRGPDNDWQLADPDKFLSKRHCVLAWRAGGWQLADTSTNGTFLNHDTDPVGATPRDLRDGDRLRLGNYEIEVRVQAEAHAGWQAPAAAPAKGGSAFGDPFGDDPFGPGPMAAKPFGGAPMPGPGDLARPGVRMPDDFDNFDDFDLPLNAPTQSDHLPGISGAFTPPGAVGAPKAAAADDWDFDFGTPAAPAPAAAPAPPAPVFAPEPVAPPVAAPVFAPEPEPVAMPPVSVAAPAAIEEEAVDPFAESDVPSAIFTPPAAVAAPIPVPVAPAPAPAPAPAAPAPAPVPAAVAAAAAPVAVGAQGDLLGAFLRGAEMEDVRPADAEAAMVRLGAAFRAVVGGLRQALIARATVKGEFRIEQTMIRARGNNPLKFSEGDDDALAKLLGAGRRAEMAPADAIGEVLRDMRLHELATMSAMQTAVRALLTRLDPGPLREEGERGGGLLPAQKRARAFDAYERLYGEISNALADDFDSVFGKAFARAYETALAEAADRERN